MTLFIFLLYQSDRKVVPGALFAVIAKINAPFLPDLVLPLRQT